MKIQSHFRHSNGFTLIELLVTVGIATIVLALGAPSMSSFLERYQISSNVQRVGSSLKYARSEAIKRSVSVTLCPSVNGSACGGDWPNGWIVFTDFNGDGSVNGQDKLLKVHGEIAGRGSLTLDTTGGNFFGFDSRGFANAAATFYACGASKKLIDVKGMIITASGNTRYATDNLLSDGIREDHKGAAFKCS